MNTLASWAVALAVTVAIGAAAAYYDAEATAQDVAALASRAFVGQAVCGPDGTAVWLDDQTLQCLKEHPEAIHPNITRVVFK